MSQPSAQACARSRRYRTPLYAALNGALLSALALLLFLPASTEAARRSVDKAVFFATDPPFIVSHLYMIQPLAVELEQFLARGGAIEPLDESLLVATPRGRLAVVDAHGAVEYLPQQVPMNAWASGWIPWIGFRVADILLHKHSQDRYTLFVSHHYYTEECVEFRVSSTSLRLREGRVSLAGGWTTEFTADPCIEFDIFLFGGRGGIQSGGRMLMDGPGRLLIVVGDHTYYEWQEEADRWKEGPVVEPDFHLGKLVRIHLASGRAEVIASGLRNPQGLARDGQGRLWQTEHGQQGGDELNLLMPETHFGWPYVTNGLNYGHGIWRYNPVQGRHDGYEKPVFAWIPSIAVSSLIVSDSPLFPLWQNDLLIGSLKDRSLFRVRLHEERVVYVEKILFGSRIRDITQMPDGEIAILTDDAKVLFLRRAPVYCQENNVSWSIFTHDADEVCLDVSDLLSDASDPAVLSLQNARLDSPVIRSLFNVYVEDDRLIYLREGCSEADLSHRFFLHITPVNAGDLAEENRQHGFNIYDFNATDEQVSTAVSDAGCIASYPLPSYEIKHVYTGQVIRDESPSGEISWRGPVWHGAYSPAEDASQEEDTGATPYLQEAGTVDHPGKALFAAKCASCHNLTPEHDVGPHLKSVIGRRAGNVDGFNASDAITGLNIVWTRENLAEFITEPDAFAPGTTMGGLTLTEDEARLIADFLASQQ